MTNRFDAVVTPPHVSQSVQKNFNIFISTAKSFKIENKSDLQTQGRCIIWRRSKTCSMCAMCMYALYLFNNLRSHMYEKQREGNMMTRWPALWAAKENGPSWPPTCGSEAAAHLKHSAWLNICQRHSQPESQRSLVVRFDPGHKQTKWDAWISQIRKWIFVHFSSLSCWSST